MNEQNGSARSSRSRPMFEEILDRSLNLLPESEARILAEEVVLLRVDLESLRVLAAPSPQPAPGSDAEREEWVYHAHAEAYGARGEVQHWDALVHSSGPIDNEEAYRTTRENLRRSMFPVPERITVTNLSLLGKRLRAAPPQENDKGRKFPEPTADEWRRIAENARSADMVDFLSGASAYGLWLREKLDASYATMERQLSEARAALLAYQTAERMDATSGSLRDITDDDFESVAVLMQENGIAFHDAASDSFRRIVASTWAYAQGFRSAPADVVTEIQIGSSDSGYFRRELESLLGRLLNADGPWLARYLRRLADVAEPAPSLIQAAQRYKALGLPDDVQMRAIFDEGWHGACEAMKARGMVPVPVEIVPADWSATSYSTRIMIPAGETLRARVDQAVEILRKLGFQDARPVFGDADADEIMMRDDLRSLLDEYDVGHELNVVFGIQGLGKEAWTWGHQDEEPRALRAAKGGAT